MAPGRRKPRQRCLAVAILGVLPVGVATTGVAKASYTVSKKYRHETGCFTEGLFLKGDRGEVFESCGLYGRSYLRKYLLESGETVATGQVPREIFSEGLALLGDALYMLTYEQRQVVEYDPTTFKERRRHPFPYGEGWGLTTDGCNLYATTGSSYLFKLAPDASGILQLVSKVEVTLDGQPVRNLNEVEYVTPYIWCNQWHTNNLWRISPETGVIDRQVDVAGLKRWSGESTPNGIAYSPALGINTMLVTGKEWDTLFLLEMPAEDLCGPQLEVELTCKSAPLTACYKGPKAQPAATPGPPVQEAQPAPAAPQVPAAATPAGVAVPPTAAPAAAAPTAAAAPATAAAPVAAVPQDAAAAAASPASPTQAVGLDALPSAPAPSPPSQEFVRPAPLPLAVTVGFSIAALGLFAAAVGIPVCLWSRRHRYMQLRQRGELPT